MQLSIFQAILKRVSVAMANSKEGDTLDVVQVTANGMLATDRYLAFRATLDDTAGNFPGIDKAPAYLPAATVKQLLALRVPGGIIKFQSIDTDETETDDELTLYRRGGNYNLQALDIDGKALYSFTVTPRIGNYVDKHFFAKYWQGKYGEHTNALLGLSGPVLTKLAKFAGSGSVIAGLVGYAPGEMMIDKYVKEAVKHLGFIIDDSGIKNSIAGVVFSGIAMPLKITEGSNYRLESTADYWK